MNYENMIAEKKKQLEEARDNSKAAYSKEWEVKRAYEDVIIEAIFDGNLLRGNKWTYMGRRFLEGGHQNKWEELLDIWMPTDYHDFIYLSDGISLRIDDGDISLSFSNSESLFEFVKEHELELDIAPLTERENKLAEELYAIREIIREIDEKVG